MDDRLQASAKSIGWATLPTACPLCVYLKVKSKWQLPYGIMPRIFSDIDRYTKNQVLAHWDTYEALPTWLSGLGPITHCMTPPPSRCFRRIHKPSGILLTGEADGIVQFPDETWGIMDFKTARYKGNDGPLMHVYNVQLNGYRNIFEGMGFGKVSRLMLIYTEPLCDESEMIKAQFSDSLLLMGFNVYIHEIPLNPELFDAAAEQVSMIWKSATVPQPHEKCQDCKKMRAVADILAAGGNPWTHLGMAR